MGLPLLGGPVGTCGAGGTSGGGHGDMWDAGGPVKFCGTAGRGGGGGMCGAGGFIGMCGAGGVPIGMCAAGEGELWDPGWGGGEEKGPIGTHGIGGTTGTAGSPVGFHRDTWSLGGGGPEKNTTAVTSTQHRPSTRARARATARDVTQKGAWFPEAPFSRRPQAQPPKRAVPMATEGAEPKRSQDGGLKGAAPRSAPWRSRGHWEGGGGIFGVN